MKRLQRAYSRLLVPAIALLALAALTACGGDGAGGGGTEGGGAGGGEPIDLNGNWSGNWQKTTPDMSEFGMIDVTFTVVGVTVGGTITLTPDICQFPIQGNWDLSGTLSGTTLFYIFGGPSNDGISATAAFPANPMNGTYSVDNSYPNCGLGWAGIFDLTKIP